MRLPEVKRRCGLSKSTIYALISKDDFPRPVRVGMRAVAWPSDAVDKWVNARIEAGGIIASGS